MSHHAASIDRYMHLHSLMQGFDHVIAMKDSRHWNIESPAALGLQLPEGEQTERLALSSDHFTDSLGHRRTILVGHALGDERRFYVWISERGEERVVPQPIAVECDANGKYYVPHGDVRIHNDRFMYDHQARAVASYGQALSEPREHATSREVTVFATGTGKSYIIAHTLKATGGDGVVIVPDGLGGQIAREIAEVIPPSQKPIHLASEYVGRNGTLRSEPSEQGILVMEERDMKAFIGTAQKPGWLCRGRRKFVQIDEAHEFAEHGGAKNLSAIAAHNDVLAITATPSKELYEALGIEARPAISMTMYDAMHRLPERPFRPLALNMVQVGEPQDIAQHSAESREQIQHKNEAAVRREALAGYFGRDEYVAPDHYRVDGRPWQTRADNAQRYATAEAAYDAQLRFNAAVPTPKDTSDSYSESIASAMERNRVRYSQHKNISFAVRGGLVRHLASDFQAIHDGTYEDMDGLTQDVWKRRAQRAVAEYIRMVGRSDEFGPSEALEKILKRGDLEILRIRDSNLYDADTQQKYRRAVNAIEPEQFRSVIPAAVYDRLIGAPAEIDLQAEAQEAAKRTDYAAQLRRTAEDALHISAKEARRLDLDGKLEARLLAEGIELPSGTERSHYYALAVTGDVPGEEKVFDPLTGAQLPLNGDDVAQMVRDGRVVHVVSNYRLTTGFSDPDVMMTQRIIENVGDHVVRATQILGRPIREKDGVAAIHEIVGPFVNLEGQRGADRHFSCFDVISQEYLDHARNFGANWEQKGRHLWVPPTNIAQRPTIEKQGPQTGKERE